ncbi:Hpt domain-containing protein [Janthinobacterium sp.]|uniref:Hpt domain-containing protein n=1 Tax=Janthinobacterium sp. TaxID=1871054 RepID=UPI00293D4328|nr:Hpt domain-containing protein [Janthinobacterium sp.]
MATLIDPNFRARLNALNDKYAAGVPDLLAAIARALARCHAEGCAGEAAVALHKSLHAVAGSAGTFGFAALGQECRRLEHLLRALLERGADGAAGWPALDAEVVFLLDWAGKDARSGAPASATVRFV